MGGTSVAIRSAPNGIRLAFVEQRCTRNWKAQRESNASAERKVGTTMNAKKILFPTDFSTCSDAGLEQATTLARDAGAKLLIIHVEEPPIAYGGGEMYYGISEPD